LNDVLEQLDSMRTSDDFGAVNGLEKKLAFNLSGHVLHTLLWKNLSPDGGDKPTGELAAAIDEFFGSFDRFQRQLSAARLPFRVPVGELAGAARKTAVRRADLRPPGQHRSKLWSAPRHGRVGHVPPPIPEQAPCLCGGALGIVDWSDVARGSNAHEAAPSSDGSEPSTAGITTAPDQGASLIRRMKPVRWAAVGAALPTCSIPSAEALGAKPAHPRPMQLVDRAKGSAAQFERTPTKRSLPQERLESTTGANGRAATAAASGASAS
jgi:hypothetical protein